MSVEHPNFDTLEALFAAVPAPYLIVAPDAPSFTIIEVNEAYLAATMRTRGELIGVPLFEAFPDNPDAPECDAALNLRRSLEQVLASKRGDRMSLQRYDIRAPSGSFEERWWEATNAPVFDADGEVLAIVQHTEDVTERRLTQEALRAERDRSVEILESISDAFYAIDSDWRFTYVNKRAEQWWGRRAEDLVGKLLWKEFPQAISSEAHHAHVKAMQERVPISLEAISPVLHRWIGIDLHPTSRGGLSVYFRDITARKESEELSREREAHLTAIFEQSAAGLAETDSAGRFLRVNDRFCRMTGRTRGELLALRLHDITHPDDLPGNALLFARSMEQEQPFEIEKRYVRPDGSIVWVHNSVTACRVSEGGPVSSLCVSIDVSARKRAEEALLRLNETLEARVEDALAERRLWAEVFERSNAVIGILAPDNRFLALNKAYADQFERVFGRRPAVGDDLGELLAHLPAAQAGALAAWGRALSGEEFTVTAEFPAPDGTKPSFELRFNPLYGRDGRLLGAFQYGIDVSDRLLKEAELTHAQEALRQSQKLEAMGQLTGGVAHDFNNLLTPILGALELIQRRGVGDERMGRLLDGALQSAERAKTLVQRLLAFARRQPLAPVAVDLAKLVEGMADLIASTSGPRIRLETAMPHDLPVVEADPNQLEMALLNLSVNARDAMPDGGKLSIAARAEAIAQESGSTLAPGDYVRLTVSDTGIGMDEAILARAIEPFFSTKGVGKGTGLGLSMVHGLATQLGGTMTIRSKPGLGTSVDLWLPVAHGRLQDARADEREAVGAGAGIVLLVDDEETVRASTAAMLVELGYSVVEASSGEAALEIAARGEAFDLLLTDHLMPGMTGAELAREVRDRWPDKRVLIISGFAEDMRLADDLPLLSKPFRLGELASRIADL